MPFPDDHLQGLQQHRDGGQPGVGLPHRPPGIPERRVDVPVQQGPYRVVRAAQGGDLQGQFAVCLVEGAQQRRGGDPVVQDVDPQRPGGVADRRDGVPDRGEHRAGVRQERPSVGGRFGPGRQPVEQHHAEFVLQGGDPLGHGLLGDPEPVPGVPELPFLDDRDKGPQELRIHPAETTSRAARQPLVVGRTPSVV